MLPTPHRCLNVASLQIGSQWQAHAMVAGYIFSDQGRLFQVCSCTPYCLKSASENCCSWSMLLC